MAAADRVKQAFGRWLAMSHAERQRLALPTNLRAMSRHLKVSERTLYRWKDDDPTVETAYSAFLAGRVEEPPLEGSEEDVPELPPSLEGGDDVREFESIRRALIARAMEGDKNALELYMRHVGKHLLEAERQAQEAGFRDLSDSELVGQVLSMIGRPAVEDWLARA